MAAIESELGEILTPKQREELGEILRRIDRRKVALNVSDHGACIAAGLSPSQIRTMRRQYHMGIQHGASIRTIARLARALKTTPEWLMSGTGEEEPPAGNAAQTVDSAAALVVAGVVAAGVWIDPASDVPASQSHVPPDPRYPAQFQSAYEVRGTSTDRFARLGDFLIVVDRVAAGLPLRSGDIVIVARTKEGLREVTARRFRGIAPNCELQFESTDSRHSGPSLQVRDLVQIDDALGGIVVAVYRPLI